MLNYTGKLKIIPNRYLVKVYGFRVRGFSSRLRAFWATRPAEQSRTAGNSSELEALLRALGLEGSLVAEFISPKKK